MSINAKAQFVKRLADGTIKLFLRLEGEELPEPTVLSTSLFKGDIVLAEQVRAAEPTAKIPAIHAIQQLSPSLIAPAVEGLQLN